MKRLVYNKLKKWKESNSRKPLILNGARQVGKTWILKEFGKNEYKNVAYVSCDKTEGVKPIFEQDFNTERIIRNLSALTGIDIKPKTTLIILDEIQELPIAITSLKYFCENAPEFHIAVAGSLLGLFLHQGISFPVGKVDIIRIYPMTFEEFLLARGKDIALKVLTDCNYDVSNSLHDMYIEELRQYYFTGGMPACVKAYTEGAGPNEIREIQKTILYSYVNDFSKHTTKQEAQRINMVWQSIPSQLAKDNKRFIYGAVKEGARAKDFELAIEWLINAGLVYKINRSSKPAMPLKFYEDFNAFKLFMLDCGLLGAMTDTPASQILIGDNAFKEYKGMFTELFVLQQLKAAEKFPTYYYSANDSSIEIDFLIQCQSHVYPIEVKAETNLRSKSLRTYISKHPDLKGIRTSLSPYKDEEWMVNIPLYALIADLKKQDEEGERKLQEYLQKHSSFSDSAPNEGNTNKTITT